MNIKVELEAEGAPPRVLEAGEIIDRYLQANLPPPADVLLYVRQWVANNRGNNRYGK
ncbi:MAG: hypothetical protein DDT38_01018 [Firmicutes bacterium]|nr:hypothetical protein [candidate division NPL-UPA2 bacterium]